jgi:hypothetical protein
MILQSLECNLILSPFLKITDMLDFPVPLILSGRLLKCTVWATQISRMPVSPRPKLWQGSVGFERQSDT